jgi:hypothetical protein
VVEAESSTSSPDQENIALRVQLLRDLVNAPRTQRRLMTDPSGWFRLCSAMDALEDTEQAMATHRAGPGSRGRCLLGSAILPTTGSFRLPLCSKTR